MKNNRQFKVISLVLLLAYVLSACAGAPPAATSAGGSKPLAQPVTYLGVIEGINGDLWTINGLTLTVASNVVRNGPFAVGDQIKVEALVNPDGSLSISRVEAPSVDDLSTLPQLGNDNDANTNDDNSNDANSNDANSNDDNGNISNSNDDNSNTSNSNDDNSNTSNSNDDNSNTSNSNTSNSNDDNSNDDNGNDSNSNDDDSNGNSGSNSNDGDGDNDNDNG